MTSEIIKFKKLSLTTLFMLAILAALTIVVRVQAVDRSYTTNSNQTAAQQSRLSEIKTRGGQEIDRRLKSLNEAAGRINNAAKLSAANKTTLTSEVNSEISGLTALKTRLQAETTLDAAKADAQSIILDYRVYALILPKIMLVRTADDQQVVETKLAALATKLQTRITNAKTAGKDVTTLQAKLDDMNVQVTNAQTISVAVEQKVINLQPGDYNSDHNILGGQRDQLKTAHTDNQAALTDARAIVDGLKNI